MVSPLNRSLALEGKLTKRPVPEMPRQSVEYDSSIHPEPRFPGAPDVAADTRETTPLLRSLRNTS